MLDGVGGDQELFTGEAAGVEAKLIDLILDTLNLIPGGGSRRHFKTCYFILGKRWG